MSVASREGGVDRNSHGDLNRAAPALSPPARGAWIATWIARDASEIRWVASREGGVDRNLKVIREMGGIGVASREGGVDRNIEWAKGFGTGTVASREGGVDRNLTFKVEP